MLLVDVIFAPLFSDQMKYCRAEEFIVKGFEKLMHHRADWNLEIDFQRYGRPR